MGVYNLNFTGNMPPTVIGGAIFFYENISSLVDIPNTKNLIALCRSRKTNITRFVSCNASGGSGDYDDPVYLSNDRYWKFAITFFWPNSANIAAYDKGTYRRQAVVMMPTMDTIDIDLYYGDTNTLVASALTKIEGTNIVVNLTADENYLHIGDFPVSYYTEYSENDVTDVIPDGDNGEPSSAIEELDAQYGTQIWQV
tara:strand:- start:748 stop:1341 length:594 start_codon:yes stop_codon:yes gene_type:complete